MKQFTLIFSTRHRNEDAVERECQMICDYINAYTTRVKYIYNGKGLIIFHVYDAGKEARHGIIATILGNIQCDTNFQSLDLQSYTNG